MFDFTENLAIFCSAMPSVEPSPPHPDRGERAKARLLESALEVFGE